MDEPKPITQEEVQKFIEMCERDEFPQRREPMILVHPRDLEAAKKFWR